LGPPPGPKGSQGAQSPLKGFQKDIQKQRIHVRGPQTMYAKILDLEDTPFHQHATMQTINQCHRCSTRPTPSNPQKKSNKCSCVLVGPCTIIPRFKQKGGKCKITILEYVCLNPYHPHCKPSESSQHVVRFCVLGVPRILQQLSHILQNTVS
jgi:hypothetical protein